jgi:hypothetical protein
VDPAALAALLLQGDSAAAVAVSRVEQDGGRSASALAGELAAGFGAPAPYRIAVERQRAVEQLLDGLVPMQRGRSVSGRIGWAAGWLGWLRFPRRSSGVPGLYLFVGRLAGTVVDWLEGTLFAQQINPFFERLFTGIPWERCARCSWASTAC